VQQQFAQAEPEHAPVAAAEAAPEPQQQRASDAVDMKLNGNVQAEAAQPSAALPQYHHHRSTALW
jgi:hypothetical protein